MIYLPHFCKKELEGAMKGYTLVFVYGTLKRGLLNYTRYLAVAEARGGAKFLGEAITRDRLNLVVRPSGTFPPVLMRPQQEEHLRKASQVSGEVFEVDKCTLEALDILEGVRSGTYYYRDSVVVDFRENERNSCSCQVYFFPATEELTRRRNYSEYNSEAQAFYQPRAVNHRVLDLCKGLPHQMQTFKPVDLKAHVVRLRPGDDLLLALQAFCREHEISAGTILSCVGSTGKTVLRPGGCKDPVIFNDNNEIVSFTGTISADSHHLHLR